MANVAAITRIITGMPSSVRDGHHAECGDKRGQVYARDQQAVDKAAHAAGQHAAGKRRAQRDAAFEHGAEQDACERNHRADR